MPRPNRAFQLAAEFRHVNDGCHWTRIHLRDFGREKNVDASFLQKRAVAGEVARIAGQILIGAELQRIDKDGNHRHVVFRLRRGNQREMTDMEETHRRYEADGFAGAAKDGDRIAQFGDSFYKAHKVSSGFPITLRRKVLDRTRFVKRGQRGQTHYID